MNRFDNVRSAFHILIIAGFLLSLSACGYKAPPYYEEAAPIGDKNVEFHYKKKEFETKENNVSCK